MKRTIAAIALFVASLFITAGIWAQGVKATVPFGFTVNSRYVPAGTYTIRSSSTDPDLLVISDPQRKASWLTMALDEPANATAKDNVLVFHKIGDQYFLSQIRSETGLMHLYFPASKAEKRARLQTQEASLPSGSSDVVVALY
jgi:hypothetical protein